jgi:hypothetical protein
VRRWTVIVSELFMEERLVEVDAIVGGERAAANERVLHATLLRRAAVLAVPSSRQSSVFQSFLIGGFECSTHRTRQGSRLDLTAATSHDRHAEADYRALARHGIRTVRDGLRWHLIETAPGRYDWSSFVPTLRAAQRTGTQVIWDLAHWGWPMTLISGRQHSWTASVPLRARRRASSKTKRMPSHSTPP